MNECLLTKAKKASGLCGAGLSCSCGLTDVGAGSWTWVFSKHKKCPKALGYVSRKGVGERGNKRGREGRKTEILNLFCVCLG